MNPFIVKLLFTSALSEAVKLTFHLIPENCRTLDGGDELAFLRVRSKKHEIMIAPDKDYILVVIQNPQEI